MNQETQQLDRPLQFGPFAVRTDAAEVTAFAAALDLPLAPGEIPLTFPIRWLALPAIRNTVQDAIGTSHPLLASQSFQFHAGIGLDRAYSLLVSVQRPSAADPQVIVRATAYDAEQRPAVDIATVLFRGTIVPAGARPAPVSALPEVTHGPIDMPYLLRYAAASHDDNPLHVNDEFARSAGFDAPVVHGMIMMGLFHSALARWGKDANVLRLSARFVQPVAVGSTLIIGGRAVPLAGRDLVVRLFVRVADHLVCLGEALTRDWPGSARPTSVTAGH